MHYISSRYQEEESHFKDIDALGLFVDNHDNARFLAQENYPGNKLGFLNALVFSMTGRGIPFFYYGSEFNYDGGKDPANRETFWESHGDASVPFDANSESSVAISQMMNLRKKS